MNRITQTIKKLQKQGEKAFIPFITAGYPDLNSTPEIVFALESGGASIVELGMPFSDPLADGPTIQSSSYQAIENGATPGAVFETIRTIRSKSEIPLIVFTYTNIILQFEIERFMRQLSSSGGDGILVPDLPLEEARLFLASAHKENLRMIFLISPLTPEDRMKRIEKISDDFVYCVSVTGVTGERSQLFSKVRNYLRKVRSVLSKPIMVGFGISDRGDAQKISRLSDGVVVGSALINVIRHNKNGDDLFEHIQKFAEGISKSLTEKQRGTMTIDDWRKKIDGYDDQILKLLNERAACAVEIGKIKKSQDIDIYSPEREKSMFTRLTAVNPGPLSEKSIRVLFERIIDESRRLERETVNEKQ